MIDWSKYKFDLMDQELDETLAEQLMFDVFIAHEYAMNELPTYETALKIVNVSTSELLASLERDKGEISAIVNSIVQKVYYDEAKQNYLYVASEMLDKLANKHAFFDGNKRTALYTAFTILNVGVKTHISLKMDNQKYVDELLLIVKSNQDGISDEKRIEQISNFLDEIVNEQID